MIVTLCGIAHVSVAVVTARFGLVVATRRIGAATVIISILKITDMVLVMGVMGNAQPDGCA